MTEKVTDCDWCPEPIPYGITCWMVKDGLDTDGKTRIVKIARQSCYDAGKTKG